MATHTDHAAPTATTFAWRLRTAVTQDNGSVPAHRRGRNWHDAAQTSVANPRRTRGLGRPEDFAERLRQAV